jgi:amino acid adenylation domain-containing protein
LPALAVQYGDFARWQRDWLASEQAGQLAYWTRQLAGAPAVLELPTDRPRPRTQTFRGAHLRVPAGESLRRALHELSRTEGVTLFMTLLAAYDVLLWRTSGQRDVVVGSPIAGRTVSEVEPLIGFFVNTLVLRVEVCPAASFRALLGRVREVCIGAYAHQDLPFEQLVDALNPVRNTSHPPVFQVAFTLQKLASSVTRVPDAAWTAMDIDLGTAKFDLTLTARETADELICAWEYNADLFDEATVLRMARHYVQIVEAAVAEPDRAVARLPLLDAAERHQLVAWNPPGAADDASAPAPHELFERQARETPDARAVVDAATSLTYRELDHRASELARRLRELGAGPDVVVALCLERSVDAVVAVLGVLKAGAAYLPLDPGHPAARLRFTLEDSAASIVVTRQQHEPLVQRLEIGAQIVCIDRDAGHRAGHDAGRIAGRDVLLGRAGAHNLAYVIYTSGSTGQPKGVELRLAGLASVVRHVIERLALGPTDTWVAVTTLSFDIATLELLAPVCSGGTAVIASREQATRGSDMCALIASAGCTVFQGTPSTYRLLLEAGLAHHRLQVSRWVMGGERVTPDLVSKMAVCGGRLINGYGPTETTIYSTMGEVDQAITIGRPVAGTEVYILSAELELQPIGVVGEIYLGGVGLARGYRRRPALTAERFVPDAFSGRPGARLYRTGDLGRWRADGRIECLGRTDDQVKIRGHRIELGELEAALAQHPGIAACAAAVREEAPGDARLIAYVVPRAGMAAPAASLRELLRAQLPAYMMPSRFVILAALPLTRSGKLDRRALPAPDGERDAGQFVEPRPGLEAELAAIWADVLRVARVGATDSFFELGGNSLLLQIAHTRIEAALGGAVPLVELFEFPTPGALAAHLAGAGTAQPGPGHADDRRNGLRQLARRRGRDARQ